MVSVYVHIHIYIYTQKLYVSLSTTQASTVLLEIYHDLSYSWFEC